MSTKSPVVPTTQLSTAHKQYARLQHLTAYYQQQFQEAPHFYVKVPGRVNLIGEHVDYCGYAVLPMGLEQSILLAVGLSGTQLQLRNTNADKFAAYNAELNDISIAPRAAGVEPSWHSYYLCGVKGILETLPEHAELVGMKVAVCGNIPAAAGLASSSALVSAAVLATAHAYKLELDCKRLAGISAHCEQYIGTAGGGMDQAIAFLARAGCAQFIEFYPTLNATAVELPSEACFVVANSLVKKNKAASSDFNERVVECRLASRLLAKCNGLANWQRVVRLRELQQLLNYDLERMQQDILKHLSQEVYARQDLLQLLEVTEPEFETGFLTSNTQHMMQFKLRQRALHVIQESMRVQEFRQICQAEHDDYTLSALSKLMRASHHSLQSLYECSHPQLDTLIAISDELGVSARLTGAGWGGFIVALCANKEAAMHYIDTLKQKYYDKLIEDGEHNYTDIVFATTACGGAELIMPSNVISNGAKI